MNLSEIREGVFVANAPIVRLGRAEMAFLKQQARASALRRARICAHKSGEDALHEMFIALAASSYIHPHKHVGKSESFHVVDGEVDIVVFGDEGEVREVIELGDAASGRKFYYRIPENVYHTLLIRTDFLVVHEVTSGPFLREQTILAPFAPAEHETVDVQSYMRRLSDTVARQIGG